MKVIKMLRDLRDARAAKKSSLLVAALCLLLGALFLLLLPAGIVRAQDETDISDGAPASVGDASSLDTASPITKEEITQGIFVSGINLMDGGYWVTRDQTLKPTDNPDSWNVAYDKATNTLTLKDATIKEAKQTVLHDFYAGILSATDPDKDLNVDIVGNNTIEGGSDGSLLFGIVTLNDLNLRGDGNLTITSGTATGTTNGNANMGIYALGGLTLQGPAVTINNGDSLTSNAGVYSVGAIDISSGSLNATAGSVTGEKEDNGPNSVGVYCLKEVNMNGGKLVSIAGQSKGNSFGICSEGDMAVNGGTISAVSNAAAIHSYGLKVGQIDENGKPVGSTEITGGQITAISNTGAAADSTELSGLQTSAASNVDTSKCFSAGIFAYGPFTMTDGDVNATASGKATTGYGLLLYPSAQGCELNMAGGTLTAASDGSYEASTGINFLKTVQGYYGNLNLSGGTITATSSPAKYYSNGVNNNSDNGVINVTGGSLTATGDQAGDAGIGVGFANIAITGGSVIAKGAAAARSSALQTEPDVSGYDAYHWRVAEGDAFANKPLVYQETTYFEIQPGALAEAAAVTNPPTGLDAQSNLLMIGAGLCLTAVALWIGYVLYQKSKS